MMLAPPCPKWHKHMHTEVLALTLLPSPLAGRQLPVRLMLFMRPKCHPLLLDATINSTLTARVNIFQARPSCGGPA